MSLMNEFRDKTVIITGGAGHVGRDIIKRLITSGAKVIIVDKDQISIDALIEELGNNADRVEIFQANLMEENSINELKLFIEKRKLKINFLVNAAAFYDPLPGWGVKFEEESINAWQKVLYLNVTVPFFLVQQLLPLFSVDTEQASIVNISSMYGTVAPNLDLYEGTDMTNPCVYSVSKAGLNQQTKWLSTMLAPKIRVNSVAPGGIFRNQNESFVEKYIHKTPLKRMCTEEDVTNAVMFLLSKSSSYITGQNMLIDGGWSVW